MKSWLGILGIYAIIHSLTFCHSDQQVKLATFGIEQTRVPKSWGKFKQQKGYGYLSSITGLWESSNVSINGYGGEINPHYSMPSNFDPRTVITNPTEYLLVLTNRKWNVGEVELSLVVAVNIKAPSKKNAKHISTFFPPRYSLQIDQAKLINKSDKEFSVPIIIKAWYYPDDHDLKSDQELVTVVNKFGIIKISQKFSIKITDLLVQKSTQNAIKEVTDLLNNATWSLNPDRYNTKKNPRLAGILDAKQAIVANKPWLYLVKNNKSMIEYWSVNRKYRAFVELSANYPDPQSGILLKSLNQTPFSSKTQTSRKKQLVYAKHFNKTVLSFIEKHGEPENSTRKQWPIEPELKEWVENVKWSKLEKHSENFPKYVVAFANTKFTVWAFTYEQQKKRKEYIQAPDTLHFYIYNWQSGEKYFYQLPEWRASDYRLAIFSEEVLVLKDGSHLSAFDLATGMRLPILEPHRGGPIFLPDENDQ